MAASTKIEPPFTETNWVVRPKTRDCVEILDGLNRVVARVMRIGQYGTNGGSEPSDIAEFIVGKIGRGERADAPAVDPHSDNKDIAKLRKKLDDKGVRWVHKQGIERLQQLLDAANDPSIRAKRDKPSSKYDTNGPYRAVDPGTPNIAKQPLIEVGR